MPDIRPWRDDEPNTAPTRWAYDQVCAALAKHRKRADDAEALCARLQSELAAVRGKALEEAAEIADDFDYSPLPDDEDAKLMVQVARDIAAAIRKLSSPPTETTS